MKLKKIIGVLLTCCLLVSATACGNKTDDSTDPGATTSTDDKATTDDAATADDSDAEVKDTVTVACAAEPDCFFPYHSTLNTNMDEVPILHNVYETPIKLGVDGSHEALLAESWEISEDGKTYTLHLRDDVTFQDGNKMTAEDVAFSLNLGGHSVGGAAQLANYDNAEATDDKTVVITLTAPYGPFLNALCGRYALIIEKSVFESVGEDGYNEAPIGTGPYKFMERISGDRVTMEAYEAYWGGVPAIKNVIFKVIADANTQMISLENGDIDVLIKANISSLLKLTSDSVKWESVDASSICNLRLNCATGPATDINFRKAVQSGINKEEVNLGVYEGYATIGDLQICPSFSGRPDEGTFKVVGYDEAKAKEYLAASNYNGEEFKILTVTGTKDESAAQIIQGQLIELGINCVVSSVDAASYDASSQAGEYNAAMRSSGVSVLDADGLFFQYHTTQLLRPGYADVGIASPEMDKLLDAGRVETDPEKRKQIYAEACDMITDNVLGITIYYDANACAGSTDLKGLVPRSLTGLYFFNDWSW